MRMFGKFQIQNQKSTQCFIITIMWGIHWRIDLKNMSQNMVQNSEQVSIMSRSSLYTIQAIPSKTVSFCVWSQNWLRHNHLDNFIKIQSPTSYLRYTELDCLGVGSLGTCIFQTFQVTLSKLENPVLSASRMLKKRSRTPPQRRDGNIPYFLFLINLCHCL